MANPTRGKYRVQVSLSKDEYQKIRKLAFEMEVTINECLRLVTLHEAERFIKEG